MGNIGSIVNSLDLLDGNYFISNKSSDLKKASAFILPGVGAFGTAMQNIKALGIMETLSHQVLNLKKPFFGICLGMQLIAKDSSELGYNKGLGWIDGNVVFLETKKLHVPHVGWNNVEIVKESPIFNNVDNFSHFYFDHSFHLQCDEDIVIGLHDYGFKQISAIQKENIFATQYHPEKSQRNGLKMLRNFLNYVDYKNK